MVALCTRSNYLSFQRNATDEPLGNTFILEGYFFLSQVMEISPLKTKKQKILFLLYFLVELGLFKVFQI